MFKIKRRKDFYGYVVDSTNAGKCLLRAKSGRFKGRCLKRYEGMTTGYGFKESNETGVPWD